MTPVYALFDDPAVVQRAVDGLRGAGIADRDIVVIDRKSVV